MAASRTKAPASSAAEAPGGQATNDTGVGPPPSGKRPGAKPEPSGGRAVLEATLQALPGVLVDGTKATHPGRVVRLVDRYYDAAHGRYSPVAEVIAETPRGRLVWERVPVYQLPEGVEAAPAFAKVPVFVTTSRVCRQLVPIAPEYCMEAPAAIVRAMTRKG